MHLLMRLNLNPDRNRNSDHNPILPIYHIAAIHILANGLTRLLLVSS